jgi:transposase
MKGSTARNLERFISTLPNGRWFSALTKRRRSRPSTAASRCCRCVRDRLSGRTPDYLRHGITNLFAALDYKAGTVICEFHRRHRAIEFRSFLETIDTGVPAKFEWHLILDNYGTHKTPAIKRWLLRHPRFHLHFTPTATSWLNLVERWFAALTEKQLRRGAHRSTRELEDAIRHYLDLNNRDPKPFIWTKTADQILESLGRFCK